MTKKEIGVLIPSYNEARSIGAIVKGLKDRGMATYVVDDGSSDRTAEIAQSEGAAVIRHDKNKGKGAALREGFRHILKKDFDAVLIMDGDGQHSMEDIDRFIDTMRSTGADMVIGNRMLDTAPMPYVRIMTNSFMSLLVSLVSGQSVPDTQCGFRLINRRVLESIELESSNYEIESELIIKAVRKGFSVTSVPIKTVYEDEKSRINPVLDTMRFIRLFVKSIIWKS